MGDIKSQTVFTKVGAYLADSPENDPVRMLLEQQMKEDLFVQKERSGELTSEECNSAITCCDRLKRLVELELRQKKAKLLHQGADVSSLNKCIALLAGVTAFLDARKEQLGLHLVHTDEEME